MHVLRVKNQIKPFQQKINQSVCSIHRTSWYADARDITDL